MRDLLVGLDEFRILQEIPKEFNAFHVRVGILRHVTAVESLVDESRIKLNPLCDNFNALLVIVCDKFFGFNQRLDQALVNVVTAFKFAERCNEAAANMTGIDVLAAEHYGEAGFFGTEIVRAPGHACIKQADS